MELERADIESSMKVGHSSPLVVSWEFGMTKQRGKTNALVGDKNPLFKHRKERRIKFYAANFAQFKKEIDFKAKIPNITFTKVEWKLIKIRKGKSFV